MMLAVGFSQTCTGRILTWASRALTFLTTEELRGVAWSGRRRSKELSIPLEGLDALG